MGIPPSSVVRQIAAGVLVLVLTLAGVGRGIAAASDLLPGVAGPVCHTGRDRGSVPADPSHHACCDACALCAPVIPADGRSPIAPATVVHLVEHARAMAWMSVTTRPRGPRLSQGPPAA